MLDCWRFLARHDVGALVRAEIVFHSGRIFTERSRWSREERRHRVLLFELAIHLIDVAATLGGGLDETRADVTRTSDGNTLAVTFAGRTPSGAELRGVLDTSGTESRKAVTLEFERCTLEVAFFPDAFRVLPVRGTPLDDLEAAARRLAAYARRIAGDRLGRGALPSRARPHAAIYRRHLARLRGEATGPAFSLASVADTMTSLFRLGTLVYDDDADEVDGEPPGQRATGADVQELMTLYALEGLLARIARSEYRDDFVLKGGVLLAAFAARRPTKDVDLQATQLTGDPEEVAERVHDIAALDVADGLVFDPASVAERVATVRELWRFVFEDQAGILG